MAYGANQLWTPAYPVGAMMGGGGGELPAYLLGDDDAVLGVDELGGDDDAILGADEGQLAQLLGALIKRGDDEGIEAVLGALKRKARRPNLPQNPWLAREALRQRARVLQDTRRMADNFTPLGVEQTFTAAQSTTITVTPTEPFTPATIWWDPASSPFFKITNISVGSKQLLGSTGAVRATSWSLDQPVPVRWASFSATRPLVFNATSLDAVNSRTAVFTIYGTAHVSVG